MAEAGEQDRPVSMCTFEELGQTQTDEKAEGKVGHDRGSGSIHGAHRS